MCPLMYLKSFGGGGAVGSIGEREGSPQISVEEDGQELRITTAFNRMHRAHPINFKYFVHSAAQFHK